MMDFGWIGWIGRQAAGDSLWQSAALPGSIDRHFIFAGGQAGMDDFLAALTGRRPIAGAP
jgi:hypothetical protein